MTLRFYDTNALLDHFHALPQEFVLCNLSIRQLQNIKNNRYKDVRIKQKAQKVIKWLNSNEDRFLLINYNYVWDKQFKYYSTLIPEDSDSRIIMAAIQYQQVCQEDLVFVTHDYACKGIAKACGLEVQYHDDEKDPYTGYKTLKFNTDQELASFYQSFGDQGNPYDMLINQYAIVENKYGQTVGGYKYDGLTFYQVYPKEFLSGMFGKVKGKDIKQQLALDSMSSNCLTLVRGPAGSGKSYLSLGYLFHCLDKNKIDKIIVFCNTVATSGSAKLGYYPGSKDQKLLDSQIGNFLASKLGGKQGVYMEMARGRLQLLPMSDIRGYDTSGAKAGIYITQAQNFDIDMMKLALQRIGNDSICILDGDTETQVDMSMYQGQNNGLSRVSQVFRGTDIYGQVILTQIHRSRIAQIAERM